MQRNKHRWIGIFLALVLVNTGCALLGQPLLRFPLGNGYSRGLFTIYYARRTGGGQIPSISYNTHERVVGANPWFFRVLQYGYAIDNKYVYCGQRIDALDLQTFTILPDGFVKDQRNVRRECVLQLKERVRGAPPESFDPASFAFLGCDFAKDNTGVYRLRVGGFNISEKNCGETKKLPDGYVRIPRKGGADENHNTYT